MERIRITRIKNPSKELIAFMKDKELCRKARMQEMRERLLKGEL